MRTWHHTLTEAALIAAVCAVGSLALLGPVLAAPTDRVYGLPSDPLGEVWRLAQFDRGEIELIGNARSQLANAPSGVELRRPADATQILYDVPAALSARLTGPLLTYNLFVVFGFLSAALATYGTMRLLGVGILGSFAAGTLFAIAPVHLVEAQLHVANAQVFLLPVVLYFGVSLLTSPSTVRGMVAGASVALCAYVTAYLLLEALALAAGIIAAGVVAFLVRPQRRRELLGAAAGAIAAAAVLLAPLITVLALSGGDVGSNLNRSLQDVATFSLSPADYFERNEASYVGIGILVLALAAFVVRAGDSRLRLTLGLATVAGFLVSLEPTLALGGLRLPMPSRVIHAVVPFWRVYGRVEIVVALCLACAVGLALDRLARYRRPTGLVLAVALLALVVADVAERPPDPASDLGHRDALAEALSRKTGTVAEYPLWGFDNYQLGPYLFRQLRHGRPLFNGSMEGTLAGDLSFAASSPTAPEARDALTLAGVREIAVHPQAETPRDPAFRLEARFDNGTRLYEVAPSRRPAVGALRKAYGAERGPDGEPFWWLTPNADLVVAGRSGATVHVTFDAVSPGVPRSVSIGRATRAVNTAPTRIGFCIHLPAEEAVLRVSTTPPPQRLAAEDPRMAGIGITHLAVRAGCR